MMKYIISFLFAVGLVVLVFMLILRGFSQRSSQDAVDLIDYAKTDTIVQMRVDGPVNSNDNHRGYRIAVGRKQTTIEITRGYQLSTVKLNNYTNNEQAYGSFLRTLQMLGFTKGNSDPNSADERGYCPDGLRYIFETVYKDKVIKRYWSTSCGGGTFRGSSSKIRFLFHRQIPDYSRVTKDLDLNAF